MARRDSIMTKPKDSKGALRRLLAYLGAFRALILLVAVLCVASNVLALWGPSLAGSAINEAAAGEGKVNFEKVTYYAVRMLAVYACSSLIGAAPPTMWTSSAPAWRRTSPRFSPASSPCSARWS